MTTTLFKSRRSRVATAVLLCLGLSHCGGGGGDSSISPAPAPAPAPAPTPAPAPSPTPTTLSFSDNTASLPDGLTGACMDAKAADMDGDGDLDLVLAMEFAANLILLNDGNGNFSALSGLPRTTRDSEDVAVADFDGDGDLDVLFAAEDDFEDELWINNGNGGFEDLSASLPPGRISNAVALIDANNDGAIDIAFGNQGENRLWQNDGNGFFTDLLDQVDLSNGTAQDIDAADVDGDGDLDLVIGNETVNRILINNGDRTFTNESDTRLPGLSRETRDIEMGDIDNDGDLDMLVSNVDFFSNADSTNYLLLNDGTGVFAETELLRLTGNHVDSDLVDLNDDGLPDMVTATAFLSGSTVGQASIMLNDGDGTFSAAGFTARGNTFEIVAADFTGDTRADLYFCNRVANTGDGGQDRLYIAD